MLSKMFEAMKGISIIKTFSKTLTRHSLITIYKSFAKPHLDYGKNNENFNKKKNERISLLR